MDGPVLDTGPAPLVAMQHQETLGVRMLPAALLCWGLALSLGVLWGHAPLNEGILFDAVAVVLFGAVLMGVHHALVHWTRSNHAWAWDLVSVGSALALLGAWSTTAVIQDTGLGVWEAMQVSEWLEVFNQTRAIEGVILSRPVSLSLYVLMWLWVPLLSARLTRRRTRMLRCPEHGVELMFVMVTRFEPIGSEALADQVREMQFEQFLRYPLSHVSHAMRSIEIARCDHCDGFSAVRVRSRYGIPGDGTRDNSKWYLDGGPYRINGAQYALFDRLRPSLQPLSAEEKALQQRQNQDLLVGLMMGGFGLGLLKKSPTLYERSEEEE